jgi:predicted MPP superfamily phosphohydrolase
MTGYGRTEGGAIGSAMRVHWKQALAGAAGLGALAAVYARFIEPGQMYLDRFTVTVEQHGLPPEGITLLHLSDLHCRARDAVQMAMLARLRRLLAAERYDLLMVTGDLIHNAAGLPAALAFLATLHPRLGAFSCPGNRDYWESSFSVLLGQPAERAGKPRAAQIAAAARRLGEFLSRMLRNERWLLHIHSNDVDALHAALSAQGIQPLVNRAAHLCAGGADLWIAGVDDLTQGQPDLPAALADVPEGALTVLLAHNPDTWLDPDATRAALVLAGHTHGGQLRLPGLGALYSQGSHLPRRRPAGWFQRGGTRMFVSRGLGQSFPFRFGAPPQAALIRLMPRRPGA